MPTSSAKPTSFDRVLVTGCRGMLAGAVARVFARAGVTTTGVDRDTADLTDPAAVARVFDERRPTLVVNCAAYTAVDQAEKEEDLATRVNGTLVGNLADACGRCGATLVHVSTDFVFDGESDRPYRTDDPTNPLGAYGRSKLAGERALTDRSDGFDDWMILRTAWLYGVGGRPFPKVILDAAAAGKPLKIVSDQHGSPTFTCDVADAMLGLLRAGARGLFHVTNGGQTTWHAFAEKTLHTFGVVAPVSAIRATDWTKIKPDSAHRPKYSVLDCSETEKILGKKMRPWEEALRDYRDLSAARP